MVSAKCAACVEASCKGMEIDPGGAALLPICVRRCKLEFCLCRRLAALRERRPSGSRGTGASAVTAGGARGRRQPRGRDSGADVLGVRTIPTKLARRTSDDSVRADGARWIRRTRTEDGVGTSSTSESPGSCSFLRSKYTFDRRSKFWARRQWLQSSKQVQRRAQKRTDATQNSFEVHVRSVRGRHR